MRAMKQLQYQKVPAEYVDAICVVFEWRQLSPEHLQSLQDFAILQILQVLLLQQQELHTLSGRSKTQAERKCFIKRKRASEDERTDS